MYCRKKILSFIMVIIICIVSITAFAEVTTGYEHFSVGSPQRTINIIPCLMGKTIKYGVINHTGDAIYCTLMYSKKSDMSYPVDKGPFVISKGVSSGYNTRTVGDDNSYYPTGYYWVVVSLYNGGSASGDMYCSTY
jgi:hypothetical protein